MRRPDLVVQGLHGLIVRLGGSLVRVGRREGHYGVGRVHRLLFSRSLQVMWDAASPSYRAAPSPGWGEAVGVGGLLLDERADGDLRTRDGVEVEHHQLRVLQLALVRVAPGAGDRLGPERRLGSR